MDGIGTGPAGDSLGSHVEDEVSDHSDRHGANPYLSGNFAPVTAELTVDTPLSVDGAIPPSLQGLYLRNGPNPAAVEDPELHHWFDGDGMVHAVELRDGTAVSYRNRWVRTRKLAAETGSPVPPGPFEPVDGPANAHVVWHAGRLMALSGNGFPHLITTKLDTLGIEDFDAMLASPMTAHPHGDPETKGMAFIGADPWGPPFLRYHELDAAGRLVHSTHIDIPRATMHHDFGVTASRIVVMDLPVVYDTALATGDVATPFRWDTDVQARIGILERGDSGQAMRWIGIDPCYVLHVMNAYDDREAVVLDVCCYERAFDTPVGGPIGSTLARLQRWRIDPVEGTVRSALVDDRTVELPRIDDSRAGRPYRFGYCVETGRADGFDTYRALLRYDLVRDETARWDPGPGRSPGEPVFVGAHDGRADDEGWLLTLVYDAGRDASDLVIIDASRFGGQPDAVIHLPARVPFGFHGSWLPSGTLR
ncbi:MAG: carotenoid oxygenase family protein [Acidimicrobiales bacterium]